MDRASRLIGMLGNDNPFARGKTISFDDDRPFRTFDDAVGFGWRYAFDKLGSRNVVRLKELLRKALARLETGLIRSWTYDRQIVFVKYVDQALAQRQFWSDKG